MTLPFLPDVHTMQTLCGAMRRIIHSTATATATARIESAHAAASAVRRQDQFLISQERSRWCLQ
jgi:hypothetical protein